MRRWAPSACSSSPTQCLTSPRDVICHPPASTLAPGAYSRSASAPDRSSAQGVTVGPVDVDAKLQDSQRETEARQELVLGGDARSPVARATRRAGSGESWQAASSQPGPSAARNSSNSPRHAEIDTSKRARSSLQNLGQSSSRLSALALDRMVRRSAPPSQSWRTFRRNHASSIWAADRCTVQTLTCRTRSVFVVIDHGRRRIRHWNVTEHPIAPWIGRQMIEATARGQQPGFLIRDRDRSDGGDFIARARRIGIETILTPLRAPNANAIAERVIGTLRRECRDHVIAVNRTAAEAGAW